MAIQWVQRRLRCEKKWTAHLTHIQVIYWWCALKRSFSGLNDINIPFSAATHRSHSSSSVIVWDVKSFKLIVWEVNSTLSSRLLQYNSTLFLFSVWEKKSLFLSWDWFFGEQHRIGSSVINTNFWGNPYNFSNYMMGEP